jgi:hypothetical protein
MRAYDDDLTEGQRLARLIRRLIWFAIIVIAVPIGLVLLVLVVISAGAGGM